MLDFQLYTLKVKVLTPLHIGCGRELLHQYDYAVHKQRTWRINEAALLDAQQADTIELAEQLASTKFVDLLEPSDFVKDSPFFRYVLNGTPRSVAEGAKLQEQLKDVFDRPYLPGTSFKGALRTALAWNAWSRLKLSPEIARLDRTPKFAARNYEHDIFGRDPNHDLLRALHISDSKPVEAEHMMILNVRVLNRLGKLQSPIELEAMRIDTEFTLTAKLDLALFSEWAQKRNLNLRGKDWLMQLPALVNAHARARLQAERAWYRSASGRQTERLVKAYEMLLQRKDPPNTFLMQLGWGAGWEGKTFGSHLKANPNFMRVILRSRKENGYGVARLRPPKNPSDFPLSRRVAVAFRQAPDGSTEEIPALPLGWVSCEMIEK